MNRHLSISFSPRQGGIDGGGVTLEITDVDSCVKVLSIDLTHEEAGRFVTAQALTVRAHVSDDLDLVGKVRQTMYVPIPLLKDVTGLSGDRGMRIIKDAAHNYEHHGWAVDARQYIRSQKRVTTEGVPLFPFSRYVVSKEKSCS